MELIPVSSAGGVILEESERLQSATQCTYPMHWGVAAAAVESGSQCHCLYCMMSVDSSR
ncbi:hypothetical protein RIEGSTA812A_PEG_462 [invertebrate metagenome]|uniref:Uncharacterized protein n=1 Tax=invertebrate metagenome TaxID=1711999 RepID=A0A484H551_9ZZZZ